jgi:hypothetical protein
MNRPTGLHDGTPYSRRQFLHHAGTFGAALAVAPFTGTRGDKAFSADPAARPKVAAVATEITFRSHAHVILENFVEPYLFNGQLKTSPVELVSVYIDQPSDRDMARQLTNDYGIPVFKSIDAALCRGGNDLAVDGVVSIGEHGRYPVNDLGQREYPRKRFFDEIVAVMKRSNRFVPLFNDKHLSFRWDWAKEMYDTARRHGIPFMAGSSVPLAQRRPALEIPADAEFTDIVSVHGGPVEGYDFHALEVLQSLVEFRRGGETGVASVQFLEGRDLWRAADRGRWSVDLLEAAMSAESNRHQIPLRQLLESPPHGILVEYKDGLKAAVIRVGTSSTRWDVACRLKGQNQILATQYYVGPWNNRGLFRALAHAIQQHFVQKKAPYPVERTLLVTGVLDAAMHSRHDGGKTVPTPHLEVGYESFDFRPVRELGKTWEIVKEDTPEPQGFKRDAATP